MKTLQHEYACEEDRHIKNDHLSLFISCRWLQTEGFFFHDFLSQIELAEERDNCKLKCLNFYDKDATSLRLS